MRVSRIQLVIAVSEPKRFCVAVDAASYAKVPDRLCEALFVALLEQGIPREMAIAEVAAMASIELAASHSRSELGSLNKCVSEAD